MACSDQVNAQDLENAKLDTVTIGEIATSKAGAASGGAEIDYAVNRFGQSTPTMQKRSDDLDAAADAFDAEAAARVQQVGVIYSNPIKDWTASTLVSQVEVHRYPAVTGELYIPLATLPFTTDATFNPANWTVWQGATYSGIIADLSQAYTFATVAAYKAFVTVFPIGKRIYLKDRGAYFEVLGFTGIGNNANIIDSDVVSQSVSLVQRKGNTIEMYGAVAGVDSSAVINIATVNHVGVLGVSSSGHLLGSQVLIPSGTCTGIRGVGNVDTKFTKAFNGDAIRIENQASVVEDLWIECDGANFTGGGVYVVSDDCEVNARITDSEDSCIICQSDGAKSLQVNSFLTVNDTATTYAIRSDGSDLITNPTNRTFKLTGGSNGPNFAGMNVARLNDTLCQRIGFDVNSDKITLKGNRFTNASNDITILGNSHIITGNAFGWGVGYNLIIDSACLAVKYDDSNINSVDGASNSTIVDNTPLSTNASPVGNTNSLTVETSLFTPEWTDATTTGDYGNSTLTSRFSKSGRTCRYAMDLIRGSTAVNPSSGTTSWRFSLPYKALTTSAGAFTLKSSDDGVWHSATAVVQGGSNYFTLQLNGQTNTMRSGQVVFGTNAQIQGAIEFEIARA